MTSRHRGTFVSRRYELSGINSLLSLEYLSLLSEKLSTKIFRTSKTDLRLCSTYQSHSQAGLCFSTLRSMMSQSEPTFALFRYALEKHRPSETNNHPLSTQIWIFSFILKKKKKKFESFRKLKIRMWYLSHDNKSPTSAADWISISNERFS